MSGRGSGYEEVVQMPIYSDDEPPTPMEQYASTNRFSVVSALSTPPTPDPNGYFNITSDQDSDRRYSTVSLDSYVPTPPSLPVSQFEPFQNTQIPYRTRSLDEVDISHVGLSDNPSPYNDTTFYPPATTQPAAQSAPARTRMPVPWSPVSSWSSLSSSDGVSPPTLPTPSLSRNGSNRSQRWRSRRGPRRQMSYHQAIPEEGDDAMELLQATNLSGHYDGSTAYDPHGQYSHGIEPMYDLSSFISPLAPHDKATLKTYNSLEASGQLSGGLGAGVQPDATLTTSYLMASSPMDITRRLTRRGTRLNRQATVRQLAQKEADKRGQIIEVVEEDPYDVGKNDVTVDISSYDQETGDFNPQVLRRTQPLKKIYYPKANWKPHTMRWPYLSLLIAVSVALGVTQEYLYVKTSLNGGIVSFYDPKEINMWDYFSFKYLGNILAVAYGILWQLTDLEVTRLEAYYQLGKAGGALAAESINVDYVTVFALFRPFVALRYKHWAVAISSICALLSVIVIPTLQSASIELTPKRRERIDNPGGLKTIEFENLWSRSLTSILFLVSALGLLLLVLLQNRHSGITADVKGIAGVAAMATKSHILMDFKDCDTVSPKEIHDKLKGHRYTLLLNSLAPDDSQELSTTDKEKYDTTASRMSSNPHPFMMRLYPCLIMIFLLAAFTAFIPALLFTEANIITEHAPWLSTALAVILKFALQTLEQDVRMMEPFWWLAQRHAPPKILTLDYVGMAFIEMPIRALWNGHLLLAALGMGSILAEGLTVCVSSLGAVTGSSFIRSEGYQGGQETPASFWASLVIGELIILYLIFAVVLVILYRRHAFLPRQPSTIASVLGFVHQSTMLWDFVAETEGEEKGTLEESNERMVERFERVGKTFGYGWYIGRDGERHVGVDVEELKRSYRWGDDWNAATINEVVDYSQL